MTEMIIRNNSPGREEILMPFLRKHGSHCMAYSTLQDGLDYFHMDRMGYMAYLPFQNKLLRRPRRVVLSNPICAQEDRKKLVESFLESGSKALFVQIDRNMAEILYDLGFKVYPIGGEWDVLLEGFDLSGKKRAKLRQWRNKAQREGVKVRELCISKKDPSQVREICDQWLTDRGGKELAFLTRPMNMEPESGVRFFWARQNGSLIGLAGFDPLYSNGTVVGYYHNFDRILSGAPNGTSAYTVLKAVDTFRDEGAGILSLGLSPLSGMEPEFSLGKKLGKLAGIIKKRGEFLYPFNGNESHKKKFGGELKKSYAASNDNSITTMLLLSKACGLF